MTQRESKRVLCVIMSGWPHQRFLERSTVVVAVNLPVSRSLSTCTSRHMQFPKVSLGSFCTDFGATIHCLTLSQRDVALRRGVHVQSLRMHPRAVKKGSEVPPYLPSQSLRAVKELLPFPHTY